METATRNPLRYAAQLPARWCAGHYGIVVLPLIDLDDLSDDMAGELPACQM